IVRGGAAGRSVVRAGELPAPGGAVLRLRGLRALRRRGLGVARLEAPARPARRRRLTPARLRGGANPAIVWRMSRQRVRVFFLPRLLAPAGLGELLLRPARR